MTTENRFKALAINILVGRIRIESKKWLIAIFLGFMLWAGFEVAGVAWNRIQERNAASQIILQESP